MFKDGYVAVEIGDSGKQFLCTSWRRQRGEESSISVAQLAFRSGCFRGFRVACRVLPLLPAKPVDEILSIAIEVSW